MPGAPIDGNSVSATATFTATEIAAKIHRRPGVLAREIARREGLDQHEGRQAEAEDREDRRDDRRAVVAAKAPRS